VFSIDAELKRLEPIDLDQLPSDPAPTSALAQWDELTKALARMGKQQLRANQNAELALERLTPVLAEAEENLRALREQCDEYRRRLQTAQRDARETRLAALAVIDMLDDLMVMARQRGDPQWVTRVERLAGRTLDSLAAMGLAEIPAADRPFDEQVHEAVDTTDRGDRDPYLVVEVIRRGFRYDGAVLRRAQVVATR
jgi:molecular chaperone GrpE